MSIDPRQPARFELPPGLYDLRIVLAGYTNATARVTLTAGCTVLVAPSLLVRSNRRQ